MTKKIQLKASTRNAKGKKNSALRSEKSIPAIIYGNKIKNIDLAVNLPDFIKVYKEASSSTLIELSIDNQAPSMVLIQDIQKDRITDNIIHVDFYAVQMDRKIDATINLHFIGESQAVKVLNGVFVKNNDQIEVKCFPADLIKEINVDISCLKTFDDYIHAKDIILPEKYELLTEPETIIAQVTAPRTEAELESLEQKMEENVAKVETIKKKEDPDKEEEKKADAAVNKKEVKK